MKRDASTTDDITYIHKRKLQKRWKPRGTLSVLGRGSVFPSSAQEHESTDKNRQGKNSQRIWERGDGSWSFAVKVVRKPLMRCSSSC